MKILFYGAGVIGSLYAARLHTAGCDVSILARGQRLADLREYGIVLEQAVTGKRTTAHVNVVEQLLRRWVNTRYFEIVIVRHANAARDEMQQLANEFQALARQASIDTPAIDQLETYIDLLRPGGFQVANT